MIHWLSIAPQPATLVQLDAYGGAISDRSNHATAFPHRRGARSNLQYQSYWEHDEQAPENIRWVEGFRRAMLPWTHAAYVNYIDRDILNFPQGLGQLVAEGAVEPEEIPGEARPDQ